MNNIEDFNQIRKLKKKDLLEICSNLYITTTGISKDALNILVAHKLGISTTGKAGHFHQLDKVQLQQPTVTTSTSATGQSTSTPGCINVGSDTGPCPRLKDHHLDEAELKVNQ